MTTKQLHVLNVLKEWFRLHTESPTLEQLAQACGWTSVNSPIRHLKALKEQGLIDFIPNKKQTITLVSFETCPTCGQSMTSAPQ